jgi:hypothetical protein
LPTSPCVALCLLTPSTTSNHNALHLSTLWNSLPHWRLCKSDFYRLLIENDSEALIWSYPQPKCPSPWSPTSMANSPSQVSLAMDLSTVSKQLLSLSEAIASLKAQEGPAVSTPGCKSSCPVMYDSSHSLTFLASTMSRDEVMSLLHLDGSSLPPVHPCNMANACDTKMHWSAEELHRIIGCCIFCNY